MTVIFRKGTPTEAITTARIIATLQSLRGFNEWWKTFDAEEQGFVRDHIRFIVTNPEDHPGWEVEK